MDRLLIFQKTYDFIVWLYPHINHIPKGYRLVLGTHIQNVSLRILLDIMRANKERDSTTRHSIQMAVSEDLDTLRILIRLLKDLNFLSIQQYAFASEKMNEIGRILQGWMKANKI